MKNTIIIIIAVLVVGVGAWYATTKGADGGAVATVNGVEIARAEYNELRKQVIVEQNINESLLTEERKTELQGQIIDSLIAQELLKQAVEDAGVSVTAEEVEQQITTIKNQFTDVTAYQNALAEQQLTEEALRTRIEDELKTQAYLEQELNLSALTATETEINSAYTQISTTEQNVPPLAEVRDQVESFVLQQKSQEVISAYLQELREGAEIEILI